MNQDYILIADVLMKVVVVLPLFVVWLFFLLHAVQHLEMDPKNRTSR